MKLFTDMKFGLNLISSASNNFWANVQLIQENHAIALEGGRGQNKKFPVSYRGHRLRAALTKSPCSKVNSTCTELAFFYFRFVHFHNFIRLHKSHIVYLLRYIYLLYLGIEWAQTG